MSIILRAGIVVFIVQLSVSISIGKLRWETQSIFYDATTDDKEMIAIFPFVNSNDKIIEVIKITSSCGRTVVHNPKVLYEPGEQDKITAKFTFGQRVGKHTKYLKVMYADKHRTYSDRLTINAQIPEKIKITPRLLSWKLTDPSIQKQVELFVNPTLGYKIRGISSIRDEVNTYIETIDHFGNYIIKVNPGKLNSAERFVVNVEFLNLQNEVISYPVLCVVR